MSDKNAAGNGKEEILIYLNIDFNSIIILGGVSIAFVGGLIYYYLSKVEADEEIKDTGREENFEDDIKGGVYFINFINIISFFRIRKKEEEKRKMKLN
jgi:hypothetical protein